MAVFNALDRAFVGNIFDDPNLNGSIFVSIAVATTGADTLIINPWSFSPSFPSSPSRCPRLVDATAI